MAMHPNIICPSVVMEGTIRTLSRERRALLCQHVREVAEGIAATHRGRADCVIHAGEPPVVNDSEVITVGRDAFIETTRVGGADDFGFYSACVPSIYFWFGSGAPGNESSVHTPIWR